MKYKLDIEIVDGKFSITAPMIKGEAEVLIRVPASYVDSVFKFLNEIED